MTPLLPYRKNKFNSIQQKLSFSFVIIVTPVVILLSLLSYRNTSMVLEKKAFDQIETIIKLKQENINNLLGQYLAIHQRITEEINSILDENSYTSSAKIAQIQKIINDYNQNDSFVELTLLNENNEILNAPGTLNDIYDEEKVLSNILNNFTYGSPQFYNQDGYLVSTFPRKNVEKITLISKFSKSEIVKIVSDNGGLGITGKILLGYRDNEKIIIMNSSQMALTESFDINDIPKAPIVQATQNLYGSEITTDIRGVEVIAVYTDLLGKNLGIAAEIDTKEVFFPLINLSKELVIVSSLTLLLLILVSILVSRSISEPLKQLKIGAEEIAKGKWNYKLNIKTGDEVEGLAQEFTRMAIELEGLYGKLEQRVKLRTAELEKEKELSERLADDLKKFLQAVENASDQIIICDSEGKIIYANDAMHMNTGFTRFEVIGQKPGKKLWGGQMEEGFYQHMWNTIKKNKQRWQGEVNNKKKSGTQYIAALSIAPILDFKGEVKYFVGIERDITKEKTIDRMKTEFISVASHQLRTPLSAVRWFAEMLLSGDAGKLKNEQKDYIQQIYDSNDRMIELVNALLNVSRIEEGRIAVDPEPTDLGKLVDQVISELTPKIKEKKLNIVISKHKNLPKISIDPKLIRQVYANLLSNAVKYTPENGEVTIIISKKEEDIISQIQDNGYGIPEDQQEKIFTKFFRADNIRLKIPDGTGLGLYIVKSVVESSGGKIWYESKPNQGTTFWFTLPVSGTAPKAGERKLEDAYL
jgi:PAS domain S-box-containing protein